MIYHMIIIISNFNLKSQVFALYLNGKWDIGRNRRHIGYGGDRNLIELEGERNRKLSI